MKTIMLYVAGPITASTKEAVDSNIESALKAAIVLRKLGYACYVPHLEANDMRDELSYDQWIEHGLIALAHCDAVCLLPGWWASNGVKMEIGHAKVLGKEVYEFSHWVDLSDEY